MSRNKLGNIFIISFVLLLLPFSAFASSAFLISPDKIKAETANYDTHTVAYGIFEKSNSGSITECYPYTYQLRFEQSGATFVEYLVRRGDEVKKGDVLARFSLESDEVTLTSKKLSLKRMEESFLDGKLSRHTAIEEMQEALYDTHNAYDQSILLLKIRRAQLALEQYIYQQEFNIANLKEEIAEIELEMAQTTLVSPFDGVIESVTYKREGDVISPTETLITLYREDYLLLRVDNDDMDFRYGMDVKVEIGRNKNKTVLTGRVVGADTLLPQARRNGYAYILLDSCSEEKIRLISPKAIVSTYYLENVMVIPRKAVTLEGGKYYVNLLIDGIPRKRFVNLVMQTTSGAWIIQGLNAGDTIVID